MNWTALKRKNLLKDMKQIRAALAKNGGTFHGLMWLKHPSAPTTDTPDDALVIEADGKRYQYIGPSMSMGLPLFQEVKQTREDSVWIDERTIGSDSHGNAIRLRKKTDCK